MPISINEVFDRLSHDSASGRLIFFCGAGISRQEPTSLPTADSLVCTILEDVAESIPELWKDFIAGSHLFRNVPFELFMAVIQQALLFRVLETLDPLTDGEPNAIHHYLVKLLTSKKVAHLFTTNFDNMLENALGNKLHNVETYYSWDDADQFSMQQERPALVKIHGSFIDSKGKDIARNTILTTIDRIYKSSKVTCLQKWAGFLDGQSIVFLGYSGRDRIDVIPMLSYTNNTYMVWVCHSSEDAIRICSKSDPLLSKEVRMLMETGAKIVPLAGRTEQFLAAFGQTCGVDFDSYANVVSANKSCYKGKPISFIHTGFVPPIFPKYANLVAGYLFLWAGWAQQAGYAFNKFVETCTDEEPRLFSNAFNALGQVFESLGKWEDSDKMYRVALSGFWGLGDYPSIVRTQYMLGDVLLQKAKYDQVQSLIEDSMLLAQRENDNRGIGMSYFLSASMHEHMKDMKSAKDCYKNAVEMAVIAGDFWLEAGSLQGIVRTERQLNDRYNEGSIEQMLSILDKIYWIGGGSAPSLKIGKMVDPFAAISDLAKALVDIKRKKNAIEFVNLNTVLNRCGQREQVLTAIRAELQ